MALGDLEIHVQTTVQLGIISLGLKIENGLKPMSKVVFFGEYIYNQNSIYIYKDHWLMLLLQR